MRRYRLKCTSGDLFYSGENMAEEEEEQEVSPMVKTLEKARKNEVYGRMSEYYDPEKLINLGKEGKVFILLSERESGKRFFEKQMEAEK